MSKELDGLNGLLGGLPPGIEDNELALLASQVLEGKMTPRKGDKRITVTQNPGESQERGLARVRLDPAVNAAQTMMAVSHGVGEANAQDLIDELASLVRAVGTGDLGRMESMLIAQAHALDTVFNQLTMRAFADGKLDGLERKLRLALKAQSQCRATLETLAVVKNPNPIAFVRQANITAGPQQVNNHAGTAPKRKAPRAGKKAKREKQTKGKPE